MAAELLRVEVVLALPEQADRVSLEVAAGTTVAEVVERSGLMARACAPEDLQGNVGRWGRHCQPTDPVEDGDRIELYRQLTVDPMVARRRRAARRQREGG